ncbi:MAG: MurR/RpiR family transcriptional regulator [Olsenella sp.]|nr:MurR/RpiR family transcriptional regulator [Olsenella sp.]
MSVFQTMQSMLPELSKNERKAAEYLIAHPHDLQRRSADAIADEADVSRSALVRLCQKLGYKGYTEFRYAVWHDETSAPQKDSPSILSRYAELLSQLQTAPVAEAAASLAEAIRSAQRTHVWGIYHSNMAAQQLSFRLNRSLKDSQSLSDMSQMENYSQMVTPQDLVVIFSISGSDVYRDACLSCHERGAAVALITMSAKSKLAKLADICAVLPYLSHEQSDYLLDDEATFFIFIEMLIERLHCQAANALP